VTTVRKAVEQSLNHVGWFFNPRDGFLYRRNRNGAWMVARMFVDGSPDLESEMDLWLAWHGEPAGYRRMLLWLEEMEELRLESAAN
jgi:hypothetical protein